MGQEASPNSVQFHELASHLLDEDDGARYDAALAIARMGKAVIEPALRWADDPHPLRREMACYILGQVGYIDPQEPLCLIHYPEGVPTLVRLLAADSEEMVRASAASALGQHALPSTIPALVRAASDPSEEVRFGAAFALGSFYDSTWDEESLPYKPEVVATLLRLMEDEDEDVRDWATFGIHQGGHDTPETRERLWEALDDPNPDVRGEAADGLAEFGDRSFIPRLEKLLREEEDTSPCYFMAAEKLGDPGLLPAVLVAAERWQEGMQEGEKPHPAIQSAIDALSNARANGLPSEIQGR